MSESTGPVEGRGKPGSGTRSGRLPVWCRGLRPFLSQAARGAAYAVGSTGVTSLVLWWQSHH